MFSNRIQNGQIERISITALDSDSNFLTDLGNLSATFLPTIEIKRESDGKYLDFNDNTFKSSGWSIRQQNMTELDSTNSPGVYYYDFNTTEFTDDNYFIRVLNDTAYNSPFEGELKVGGFIDNIDASIDSRSPKNEYDTALSNIQTEVDKIQDIDDNIDSIITTLSTLISDIWGYTARTLTEFGTLASDVWAVTVRTLTAIGSSGIASESNATSNTSSIIDEIDDNEGKIDTINSTVNSIQSSIENATYGLSAIQVLIDAIDTSTELTSRFDEIKGAGWTSETLKSIQDAISAIVDNVDWTDEEKKQIRSALGIDGDKVTAQNGQIQTLDTNITSIKNTVDHVTYGLSALKTLIDAIDTSIELTARFDEIKGSGWTTETLKNIRDAINTIVVDTDWTVAERKQIRDALGVDGLKTTAQSGQLQTIKTETDKIQTIDNNLDAIQILVNRILGLQQENFRILNPVYNTNHLLTSATIRIYSSANDCTNDVTPLASYTVTATYNDDNEMLTYKVTKN